MKKIVKNQMKFFHNFDLDNPKINTINLELTNICDLHCKMCKRGKRQRGYMDLGLAKDILKEAKDMDVKQIGLHTVGESILHPKFDIIIQESKKYDFYTYLDVNGNTLNREKAEKLVAAGLDSIKFSIDAADDETYVKIRRGGKFTKVYENIRYLKKIRDESNSKLRIFCLFIIMQENIHQREKFKEIMTPWVDEIQYTVINQAAGRMDKNIFMKSDVSDFYIPNESGVCANPFTRMVITWQGDVSMCCIDFDLDMKIGKFEKEKLRNIWDCKKATEIRSSMINRKYEHLPSICRGCDNLKYDAALRSKKINEIFS